MDICKVTGIECSNCSPVCSHKTENIIEVVYHAKQNVTIKCKTCKKTFKEFAEQRIIDGYVYCCPYCATTVTQGNFKVLED
jgi:hypothetical protein